MLEKNCQDDIAERQKAERVKRETKEALTEQMQSRIKEAERQKEREAKFRDVVGSFFFGYINNTYNCRASIIKYMFNYLTNKICLQNKISVTRI